MIMLFNQVHYVIYKSVIVIINNSISSICKSCITQWKMMTITNIDTDIFFRNNLRNWHYHFLIGRLTISLIIHSQAYTLMGYRQQDIWTKKRHLCKFMLYYQ